MIIIMRLHSKQPQCSFIIRHSSSSSLYHFTERQEEKLKNNNRDLSMVGYFNIQFIQVAGEILKIFINILLLFVYEGAHEVYVCYRLLLHSLDGHVQLHVSRCNNLLTLKFQFINKSGFYSSTLRTCFSIV